MGLLDRLMGKKSSSGEMTPEEERAKRNIERMQNVGITEFKWMHSGVDLPCNGEDHRKYDGKKYGISTYLKTGKTLPGGVKGCRCTFSGVVPGFE